MAVIQSMFNPESTNYITHHLNFNLSILVSRPGTLSWTTSTVPHPPANQWFRLTPCYSGNRHGWSDHNLWWPQFTSQIDDDLAKLLHSTSFTGLLNSPTRQHIRSIIFARHHHHPITLKFISTTSVVSLHKMFDHDLTLADISTKRYKSPQRTYQYRDIKSINPLSPELGSKWTPAP